MKVKFKRLQLEVELAGYEDQLADMEAEGDYYSEDYEDILESMKSIQGQLDDLELMDDDDEC